LPDSARIERRLQELWRISLGPGGGADRPAFSESEATAMLAVAGWAREAGLETGLDRHGNLWALPAGRDRPLVTSGSHVDTVPDGGRYDGALGTVLGLELAGELGGAAGLLVCAAEEAPRFGAGTIGSRLLAGTLDDAALADLHDAAGVSAASARAGYLETLSSLPRIEAPLARWRAHGEIHIAQRRALRELGVVTRVASPRRFELQLTGQAGHAGEVAMPDRHDALAAGAEVVLAVEHAALAAPAGTVATVGTAAVSPGAVSVIPGRVRLGLDVRGVDLEALERLDASIRAAVAEIAQRRGVDAELRLVRGGDPVALDPGLAGAALAAAGELGVTAAETWSGAGHDAQHLAGLVPALLLFVPLHGGESHTPQEAAEMREIIQATDVAARVLGQVVLDTGRGV
jgi:hydantoinase/carbamoylase family amidase